MQDERSAAYFALGRIQATARAVAVLAGSGSAAAALMPAVIEAYYQRRPLIIITLDEARPRAGAYGHIEQEGLFGFYAPTQELHLPCALSELPDMVALCTEGFPAHLHLCCEQESQMRRGGSLIHVAEPPAAPPFRGSLAQLAQMLRFHAYEGLVLLLGELDPAEQEPALWLARTLRVPVLADATSGLREKLAPLLLHGGDELLAQTPPRYVLRLGSVPACSFWNKLEDMADTEVFSITRSGFSGLSRPSVVMEGELEQIMKALGDVPHIGDTMGLLAQSRRNLGRIEEQLLSYPESAAALVQAFSRYACLADVVFLGSPSITRLWNRYAQLQMPTLYTRSVSQAGGTDGVLGAFFGNAVDAEFACALVGDIALIRDLPSAQFLTQLPPGKRIIAVLNNGGAGMAHSDRQNEDLHRLIVQPPGFTPQDLARLCRAEHYTIRTEADLEILDNLENNATVVLDLQPERS